VTCSAITLQACTVEGNTVTPLKSGTCTIKASAGGDDVHSPAEDVIQSFDVTVQEYYMRFWPAYAYRWSPEVKQ
jgi:hypothetical protein